MRNRQSVRERDTRGRAREKEYNYKKLTIPGINTDCCVAQQIK